MRTVELVRPGGVLVLIGLAPPGLAAPRDYAEVRRIAARLLPGVRYRRHVLWRFSLVWTRP